MAKHTNRLIHETSPYLQQHAHNPVDWYPWGEEALTKARTTNKPILLSIGYSACHWCHVMEHESFEDEDVARVMNEHLVCIKVDREERPDLDKIYQLAHQVLARRPGGWPLNIFLMPQDQTPFFGGTYFPKTPRHGMPGFADMIERVASFFHERREDIEEQNREVRALFERIESATTGGPLDESLLDKAASELKRNADARFGGFGSAPKFPHPTALDFLLAHWANHAHNDVPDDDARHAVVQALSAMARGGLCDQLRGGFYRYSVDERWTIPHFEKMLYDNAQLLLTYTNAWLATRRPDFRQAVEETAQWVMREMQSPGGGYYSTLDADSEGQEGKFYVWDAAEMRTLLTSEEWDLIEQHYGLHGTPNFEGQWHLNVAVDTAGLTDYFDKTEVEVAEILSRAKAKLFTARERRVRPGRDEKILTSWNGLMVRSMARAGAVLERTDLIVSAERAFDFVRRTLWQDQRLLATTKDGKTQHNAYLDDYAFLIDGGLALLEARWRDGDLAFLQQLAERLLSHFEDKAQGSFFFTSDDHEPLLHRPKPASDDATPSGNGVAARVLLRLGHLTGESRYLDAAERTLKAMAGSLHEYPSAHGALLLALDEYLHPTETIVIRGEADQAERWQRRSLDALSPRRLCVTLPPQAGTTGLLAERTTKGDVTAYVCSGHACQAPMTTYDEFDRALRAREIRPD